MFQIITAWNFVRLKNDLKKDVNAITLRGYNPSTFLTGEFSRKIYNHEIRSLSVSDIADFLCPNRRDLYLKKGKNINKVRRKKTWGGVAGRIVEKFIFDSFNEFKSYKASSSWLYSKVIKDVNYMSKNFGNENSSSFSELDKLKSRGDEDPNWLLKLLTYNGRAELGLRLLHKMMSKGKKNEMDVMDLEITQDELNPKPWQIGISRGVKPDFISKKYKVVGDIKTGIGGFKDYYLLTCAGYALAYENEMGKDGNINFGIIYFFPTRYSEHAKPISFGQVYIFPIDDALRNWFINIRNDAYRIISKELPPSFPDDKSHCSYCQFFDVCKSQGLRL